MIVWTANDTGTVRHFANDLRTVRERQPVLPTSQGGDKNEFMVYYAEERDIECNQIVWRACLCVDVASAAKSAHLLTECNLHLVVRKRERDRGKRKSKERKKEKRAVSGAAAQLYSASGMREMPCVAARTWDRNVSGRDSSRRQFPPAGKENIRRSGSTIPGEYFFKDVLRRVCSAHNTRTISQTVSLTTDKCTYFTLDCNCTTILH